MTREQLSPSGVGNRNQRRSKRHLRTIIKGLHLVFFLIKCLNFLKYFFLLVRWKNIVELAVFVHFGLLRIVCLHVTFLAC